MAKILDRPNKDLVIELLKVRKTWIVRVIFDYGLGIFQVTFVKVFFFLLLKKL